MSEKLTQEQMDQMPSVKCVCGRRIYIGPPPPADGVARTEVWDEPRDWS